MQPNDLSPELLAQMSDYWRIASQTATKPIYLYDNPLFKEPSPAVEIKQLARNTH